MLASEVERHAERRRCENERGHERGPPHEAVGPDSDEDERPGGEGQCCGDRRAGVEREGEEHLRGSEQPETGEQPDTSARDERERRAGRTHHGSDLCEVTGVHRPEAYSR